MVELIPYVKSDKIPIEYGYTIKTDNGELWGEIGDYINRLIVKEKENKNENEKEKIYEEFYQKK